MKEQEMTFETAMQSLEQIVEQMENGTLSLEESLSQFEKAMKLVGFCNEKIANAEQKVKILIQKNGDVVENDFASQA